MSGLCLMVTGKTDKDLELIKNDQKEHEWSFTINQDDYIKFGFS